MVKQLLIIAGADKGRSFPLPEPILLTIGRSQLHADAQVNDPAVSRVHCQVQLEDGRAVLTDLDSSTGTCVNGRKTQRHELKSGDVIRIGDTQLRFQTMGESAGEAGPPQGARLDELTGKTVSHYQVGPVIAKGHAGLLFRAQDTKANRAVAFKVLWPEFSKSDEEMQRFVRAMKTMLPLNHPNLTALCGAGKTGGYCWMAMEFIEGESLTQVIHRIGTAGMLDWRYALRVAVHVGRALEYAHQEQIIHRNVTPPNIMIRTADRTAKLGDLMLAKALEGTLAEQITKPGELLGDLSYMSPERTRGTHDIDGRSDLYSLGATVYALLTGKPPFEGLTLAETITKIRQADPARPKKAQPSLPDAFEAAILRALAKRPEDRFQTAGELLAVLEKVAKTHAVAV